MRLGVKEVRNFAASPRAVSDGGPFCARSRCDESHTPIRHALPHEDAQLDLWNAKTRAVTGFQ
jgi:hypothetical protein